VHDHITRYLTSELCCARDEPFDCDAVVLGSLLKSSVAIGIWPRPTAPYHGIAFKNLASRVQEMQVLDDCKGQRNYYSSGFDHRVKTAIKESIKSLEDRFRGLKLDSFLSETQSTKKSKPGSQKNKYKKKKKKQKKNEW
jgi:hypothetical protein